MIHKSTRPEVEIPEIPLHQYVLNQRILKEHANKVALIDGATDFSLTYQQLHQMMFAISKNLVSKFGAQKGQVLGIMMPNHPLYAAFFHGAVAAGLTITTINPLYTETELRKQLLDSGARFLLTIPMFMDKVNHIMNQQQQQVEASSSSSANENTRVEHVFLLTPQEPATTTTATTAATTTTTTTDDAVTAVTATLCAKEHLLCKPSDLEPLNIEFNPREDVVVLPYSSGTTGVSKGVQLTHYNLVANLIQIQSIESHYDHNLKLIGILPMFHIYGLTLILNKALEVGGTLVSMAKFDFVAFLTLVQKHRFNGLHIVPPIILAMAKHPIVAQFDLSSVQFIISGAAPLAPSLAVEMKNKFNITVKQGYGMTESSPVTCINPSDDNKHESSGALLSHTELKVVSVETGEALPISTPTEKFEGELCFRGPQVMKGYLNNEQATRETIDEEGWLHTGDIGYYEDGHVYITDRLKELIKFKGFQVPPAELEAILVNHDKIADAAVIGVPDDEAGELPKAFIVLVKASPTDNDNETDEEELKKEIYEYVAAKVAPYKKLRQIEFVNEIPKSAAGKILRRVLKEKELAKLSAAAQTH